MTTEPTGRALALDVGDRTLGVAISDPSLTIAQGLTTIRRTRPEADLDALRRLIREHEVTRILVGWPVGLNGREGPQARKVAVFAVLLADALGLPVERMDERLTTVAAERALIESGLRRKARRRVIDQVAATLILQSWLDARRALAPRACPEAT